jgi:hypothetical protein
MLIWFDKHLILDYFSVIYVKFFCAPSQIYYYFRLFIIFIINFIYIFCSRGVFIQTVFWNKPLPETYNAIIYIILFAGISIIYFRLLINLSMFLVNSALHINPSLLSPSILYVLGHDDQVSSEFPKNHSSQNTPENKRFSLINISYYRQYFSSANPNGFRYLGYGLAICGTAVACGTFWYTRVQTQASIIQAEQARQQTYHTAKEADVAAVEAKLITTEEYYRRHPEDKK